MVKITTSNIDKLILNLKEDLGVEKLSDEEQIIDDLVEAYMNHQDCDNEIDIDDNEVVIELKDKLERISDILDE